MANKDQEVIAKSIVDAGTSIMVGCSAIAAALSDGILQIVFALIFFIYVGLRLIHSAFKKGDDETVNKG